MKTSDFLKKLNSGKRVVVNGESEITLHRRLLGKEEEIRFYPKRKTAWSFGYLLFSDGKAQDFINKAEALDEVTSEILTDIYYSVTKA